MISTPACNPPDEAGGTPAETVASRDAAFADIRHELPRPGSLDIDALLTIECDKIGDGICSTYNYYKFALQSSAHLCSSRIPLSISGPSEGNVDE